MRDRGLLEVRDRILQVLLARITTRLLIGGGRRVERAEHTMRIAVVRLDLECLLRRRNGLVRAIEVEVEVGKRRRQFR